MDIERVSALIAEAAAAEIVPRFGKLGVDDVRAKGPSDPVTVADLAMERRLTAALPGLLPGSTVVGEEAVSDDALIHDRLDGDDPVWVIDPLDGTTNFTEGRPAIAVIVALVRHGRTVAGWIHDPLSGATATVEEGAGAWLDGKRLSVAPPTDPPAMIGALNFKYFPDELRERLKARRDRVNAVRPLFCAGQEYLRLTRAEIHFAQFWRIKPWDHAAGVLLHCEAGGHAARINGEPYRPTDREGGLLLAPDEASWRALNHTLLGPA
ncbi:MAG: inositol monophosphatase [Proteobacteria bacterium]|nr:inositol monophosphatase [Pseudomonadota bacterium]